MINGIACSADITRSNRMRRIVFIMIAVSIWSSAWSAESVQGLATSSATFSNVPEHSLQVPSSGVIKVAFIVSAGTTLIDVAGPMQTFHQVNVPNGRFETFTVSATRDPTDAQGLTVVPDYAFDSAPEPDIVVVAAQSAGASMGGDASRTQPYLDYIKRMASSEKLMVSVCTGASIFAKAGLLEGTYATSHHDYIDGLSKRFATTHWLKDKAYVHSSAQVYTAGGETSGFEVALHIVQLYFGHKAAVETARSMEYRGPAWQS